MLGKKKLLISNLVYGPYFLKIFTDYHLKSLLAPEAIPTHKHRTEYLIFTDDETLPQLQAHPVIAELKSLIPVQFCVLGGGKLTKKMRYTALIHVFKESVQMALKKEMLLCPIVADSFFARDCLAKFFLRLDDTEYESILSLPMRAAYEPMAPYLDALKHDLSSMELFHLAYKFMHPLWVASHWNSPQFSSIPFSILWNTGEGVFSRSFSTAPICFWPTQEMLAVDRSPDAEMPALCKKPYWATNWIDVPIIGIDPLMEYYPPFTQKPSDIKDVAHWAKKVMYPCQFEYFKKEYAYPCKEVLSLEGTGMRQRVVDRILEIVAEIK